MSGARYIPPLRLGVFGEGTLSGDPTQDKAISAAWVGEGTISVDTIAGGKGLNLAVVGALITFSTLWGVINVISPPEDSLWGASFTGGAAQNSLITVAWEHERTPVKYVRKDDLTLAYSGDQLTTVTKESGDTLTLAYDGSGNLIEVENSYTGLKKVLAYDGDNKLTGVVRESV